MTDAKQTLPSIHCIRIHAQINHLFGRAIHVILVVTLRAVQPIAVEDHVLHIFHVSIAHDSRSFASNVVYEGGPLQGGQRSTEEQTTAEYVYRERKQRVTDIARARTGETQRLQSLLHTDDE